MTIVVTDSDGFWRVIQNSPSTAINVNDSADVSLTGHASSASQASTGGQAPYISPGESISAVGTIGPDHTTLDASSVTVSAIVTPGVDMSATVSSDENPASAPGPPITSSGAGGPGAGGPGAGGPGAGGPGAGGPGAGGPGAGGSSAGGPCPDPPGAGGAGGASGAAPSFNQPAANYTNGGNGTWGADS